MPHICREPDLHLMLLVHCEYLSDDLQPFEYALDRYRHCGAEVFFPLKLLEEAH
uniref:Uncharacterized protein n=1 Tax=Arundo donax TaxID=35708 RepID=A0A0A9A1H1_ARUDO